MPPIVFDRIAIIGLGLIGGSIARAAHEKRVTGHITVCDTNQDSLTYAKEHGFAEAFTANAVNAAGEADLVILSCPPSALGPVMQAIAAALKPGCIVMDVCSVKRHAIGAIAPHIPKGVYFLPAHPIAGSEQSGVRASRADLFESKRVIITPENPESGPAVQCIAFWHGLGASPETMTAPVHDMVYAYVSHLPQLLAFAAFHSLGIHKAERENNELLRKFLRLSDSNPALWVDIFRLNSDNLLTALDRYLDAVLHLRGDPAARGALFPRIAASCLVTTLAEAEREAGLPFTRYAGTGYDDFSSPARQQPEDESGHIAPQDQAVGKVLDEYIDRLRSFRLALASRNSDRIASAMNE